MVALVVLRVVMFAFYGVDDDDYTVRCLLFSEGGLWLVGSLAGRMMRD